MLDIFLATITLLYAIIIAFLVPYIRLKKDKETLEEIFKWTDIFVYFAEEIYKEFPKSGNEKHLLVRDKLKEITNLSNGELNVLIKSSVNKMNKIRKKLLE